MFKLVALDCDGTLLNSKKQISPDDLASIVLLIQHGVRVLIASARPFYRLQPIISKLGIAYDDQYTIAFNGGLITNNTGTQTLASKGFSVDEVRDIVATGRMYGTNMFLYSRDAVYSNTNDEVYQRKNPDVTFHVTDLATFDVSATTIFKIAYVNTPEDTQRLRAKLPVQFTNAYEISSSVPQFVEIVPKGITKAQSLGVLCKHLKISNSDVIAFGDQDNDVPMLDYAGVGVAMGNASDEVIKHADFVTSTNDENGVSVAICHFFPNIHITRMIP